MRIIDAHLHMKNHEGFDDLCREAGHENSLSHLTGEFGRLGIRAAVVMGSSAHEEGEEALCRPGLFNLGGEARLEPYNYPKNVFFCAGINPEPVAAGKDPVPVLANYEAAASCPNCVGFKVYLGYQPYAPDDPVYRPFYELARRYDLTVVFHTGDTATAGGRLRYSHPLGVDEAAVRFPDVRFVMAHFGNPWPCDAAEVAKKNPNVFADLSGLAVGKPDAAGFHRRYEGYAAQLKTWLGCLDCYDKVLYGSDWPLVNLERYLQLIKSFVPEEYWDNVFYQNALRAFPRMAQALAKSEREGE